ncbi:MAG: ribulose-phosphate 3-epimerase, ribulose-phosphate 3-epimerase [Candidatus Nomurabacteria bacterium]|nr:ribulose-phosphate 3-epimerase, ribulose-phosphate 3-epimerase [Candidatus Nomurabacteria bacterium]
MIKITPAILPHSYKGIEIPVERVLGAVTNVQIDIVDGHFSPNRTWLFNNKDEDKLEAIYEQELGMPYWAELNYEFDLMVKDPIKEMDMFIALGPAKMIFHLEGLEEEKTVAFFEALPEIIRSAISFGIAIGIGTDPAGIAPYIPYIESIQCMGIKNVGYQGQAFDEGVFTQITAVKKMYPDKSISVDGGVSLENAAQLVMAGATELVIGSALFQNTDSRGTIETFQRLCNSVILQSENSN